MEIIPIDSIYVKLQGNSRQDQNVQSFQFPSGIAMAVETLYFQTATHSLR